MLNRWKLTLGRSRRPKPSSVPSSTEARHKGPQLVTRNGKEAVVVVDATEWERLQKRAKRGSFADFLLNSPLRGSGIETTRLAGGLRHVDL